jgi:hypothetical protein
MLKETKLLQKLNQTKSDNNLSQLSNCHDLRIISEGINLQDDHNIIFDSARCYAALKCFSHEEM